MKIIRDLIRKAKANFVGKSFERKSADSLEQRALKALIKEQEEKIERLRDQVERLVKAVSYTHLTLPTKRIV